MEKTLFTVAMQANAQFVTVPATLPEHPELHGAVKAPYKKKHRERKGFWALPAPKQRRMRAEVSGGGALPAPKDKTLPRFGMASFFVEAAEYSPRNRIALKSGEKRRRAVTMQQRAPEVQERDMRIQYDRERVAMGCQSVLVRVVKGCGKRT